ncbi:hypothetical protein DFQ28_001114 [Apophysomyces sp. BC1034]|nr:hypothetical protein DFQ30_001781 [Apophysomyces sp. BC1015]KAG0166830.1 hypothetical protein DFQ29_000786 [Apophysomyces sp. BC1021]KAG0183735.1 hypothetical protein DFQ28_001114 [Apophysomyces sp. BC1034]
MGNALRFVVFATGVIGSGYALMKLTVPSEQEMRERLTPHLQREAQLNQEKLTAQRQQLIEHLREVAESGEPAWKTETAVNSKQ